MNTKIREIFYNITNKDVWTIKKFFGVLFAFVVLTSLVFLGTGCSKNNDATVDEPSPVEELPKDNVKVGDDGVSAAIAPDEDPSAVARQDERETVSMVAMSVEDTGRSDPFLPDGELPVVTSSKTSKPVFRNYDLLPPPETITVDTTAAEVITTKVSGIMYDNYNPSAILNISGSDYLVRSGDVIDGYKVLSIARDNVTVQRGSNVYKAGVGELFSSKDVNFNKISNLEGKFGGHKNTAKR